MKHRRSFYVVLAFEIFLIVLGVFLAGWWLGAGYPFFDAVTTRGAKIPGEFSVPVEPIIIRSVTVKKY